MACSKVLSATILTLALLLAATAAEVAGKWTAEIETPIGLLKYTYVFKVDGAKLTGRATWEKGDVEIREGKVTGDEISFVEMMRWEDMDIRIEYRGKVSGEQIKFTRKVGDFATEEFVAKRAK